MRLTASQRRRGREEGERVKKAGSTVVRLREMVFS